LVVRERVTLAFGCAASVAVESGAFSAAAAVALVEAAFVAVVLDVLARVVRGLRAGLAGTA
jgi:hypothetical protein